MLEHYSLLHHKVGFLPTQYQSFPNVDLENLSQVSQAAVVVISKDEEIVHEDFETVDKKIGEDCRLTSIECHGGITLSEWHLSKTKRAKGTCKLYLFWIIRINSNLVIGRVSIQEAKVILSCKTVQDVVNEW